MAESTSWEEISNQKFCVFDIESTTYQECSNKSNGPEMFAKFICDAIKLEDVPDALKSLYMEAVYGSDIKVKTRIRNRMYLIGRHVRYSFHFSAWCTLFLRIKNKIRSKSLVEKILCIVMSPQG